MMLSRQPHIAITSVAQTGLASEANAETLP